MTTFKAAQRNVCRTAVIRVLNVPDEYAGGTIRISFGRYNTAENVEAIAAELAKILCAKLT